MKKMKAVVGVLIIFGLGVAVGTLSTRMIYEARVDALVSGDWKVREDALVKRFGKHLDLDDAQRDQVRVVIRDTRKDLTDLYQPLGMQIAAVKKKSQATIKAFLRPEQAAKYEKMQTGGTLRQ